MKLSKAVIGIVSAILLAAVGAPVVAQDSVRSAAKDAIMFHDPYVRAVPPGQPNSAAFMHLKNNSDMAHAIVAATSDVSKVVELHTHTHENGMMKMRRIDKIDIPAKGEAMLKPGGLHIMLIGLKQGLKLDQQITLNLEFSDGSKKTIQAPVRKIMAGGMMKGMMKGMKH